MEKISEISEYLIFKTDADAFGQWENPMEGVLGSDEMFLLERLRWQAPSAVHQAACVVIKFLETFGARVRVTNFVVRIRMVRTITRAYRRYKQRRTRLIQRLAQHWQSMEQAGDWARLFKSGSQDISPDSEESVPVWVLIARPIPRSSKLTVTKTLYSLKQKEYCEAFRRWKKEQEVVYRLELKKAQEQEVEYKLRQELAEQSTVAGKAGAVEPITLLPPPMPPPPPTFKPSPQDFFLVPPSSRAYWLRVVAEDVQRSADLRAAEKNPEPPKPDPVQELLTTITTQSISNHSQALLPPISAGVHGQSPRRPTAEMETGNAWLLHSPPPTTAPRSPRAMAPAQRPVPFPRAEPTSPRHSVSPRVLTHSASTAPSPCTSPAPPSPRRGSLLPPKSPRRGHSPQPQRPLAISPGALAIVTADVGAPAAPPRQRSSRSGSGSGSGHYANGSGQFSPRSRSMDEGGPAVALRPRSSRSGSGSGSGNGSGQLSPRSRSEDEGGPAVALRPRSSRSGSGSGSGNGSGQLSPRSRSEDEGGPAVALRPRSSRSGSGSGSGNGSGQLSPRSRSEDEGGPAVAQRHRGSRSGSGTASGHYANGSGQCSPRSRSEDEGALRQRSGCSGSSSGSSTAGGHFANGSGPFSPSTRNRRIMSSLLPSPVRPSVSPLPEPPLHHLGLPLSKSPDPPADARLQPLTVTVSWSSHA